MEHSKHLWRVVLILMVFFLGFVGFRHFMVPKSFGLAGPYRYDSIQDHMALPVVHGGRESCKKCHEEKYDMVMKGKHKAVSCEVCHEPVTVHAKDGAKIADMPKSPTWRLCELCHAKMAGRPKTHPRSPSASTSRSRRFRWATRSPRGSARSATISTIPR